MGKCTHTNTYIAMHTHMHTPACTLGDAYTYIYINRDLLTRASFTCLPVSTRGCVICAHVNAGSDASGDCACNAGYTGPNGGTCTACETGKYKDSPGGGACTACPDNSVSPAGLCGLFV